jgi:hypothetical protein
MARDTLQFDAGKFKDANRDYIARIEREGLVAIYDAALDTLFLEIGGPREALTEHVWDNVMVRIDPETLEVVGLEILDFLEDFVPNNRLIRDAISGWGLKRDADNSRTFMAAQYAPVREVVEAFIGQLTQHSATST